MNFLNCRDLNTYDELNEYFRDKYLTSEKELIDSDLFQLLHIEGGHVPYDLDESANSIDREKGTYKGKVGGIVKLTADYLNMLKQENVYDNSAIVIMSDHGYCEPLDIAVKCRFNPSLYIKGINEHHHAMKINNNRLSQSDFQDAFVELMDGAKATELFSEITDKKRQRRGLIFEGGTIEEYMQSEHAWSEESLIPTGKTY